MIKLLMMIVSVLMMHFLMISPHSVTRIKDPMLTAQLVQSQSYLPERMPEDFNFQISWDFLGQHHYNSKTGKAYMQYFEEVRDELEGNLVFSEKDMEEIWSYIVAAQLDRYPQDYLAGMEEISPPLVMSIQVAYNDQVHQVSVHGLDFYDSETVFENPDLGRLLTNLAKITEKIEASEEWQNLPDPILPIE